MGDLYRVGYFVVEKHPRHDARFARVSQPERSCRHLLLDYLNLNGGRHDVLLNGKHERFRSLEDITQCRRVGNIGCSRTLLLHARVLDHHRYVSDPVSVHRLVDYCSFANGRILLHSPQSNPTLEQECSSACFWEHVRCWLSVILARRISSTHGQDSCSAWLVGHSSFSKSLQVKLVRNQLLWEET